MMQISCWFWTVTCVKKISTVLQYALGLVVKESFTLYKAVSEGIINLADTFFEMEYLDAGEWA